MVDDKAHLKVRKNDLLSPIKNRSLARVAIRTLYHSK